MRVKTWLFTQEGMHFIGPGLHHQAPVLQWCSPSLPPVTRAFVASQLAKWSGGRGKHTAPAPACSGVLPVNVLMGKHLLTQLLGIPLQHLPCFMLEVGNQPKEHLCFWPTQPLVFSEQLSLTDSRHPREGRGVTACCSPPHSLPRQQPEEKGGRNLEAEMHLPHVNAVKVLPSLPGFPPCALCGVSLFCPSSQEDPLATSENLILHLPWLLLLQS